MKTIEVTCDAGLCNRLRVVDSCLLLARELDRTLDVYWPVNDKLGAKFGDLFEGVNNVSFKHHKTEVSVRSVLARRLAGNKTSKVCLNGNLMTHFHLENSLVRNSEFIRDLGAADNIHIQTVHSFLYPEDFSYLRPLAELREAIRRIVGLFDEKTVGLHIRRGDHAMAIQNSPLDGFIRQTDIRLAGDPDVKFFLATDDEAVRTQLAQYFGKALIWNDQTGKRDSKKGAIAAVIDLFSLSRTPEIWGSKGSSFSETAYHLGKGKLRFVDNLSLTAPCKKSGTQ